MEFLYVRAAIVAGDKSDVYGNNVAAHCRFLSFAVDLHLAQFMISERERAKETRSQPPAP